MNGQLRKEVVCVLAPASAHVPARVQLRAQAARPRLRRRGGRAFTYTVGTAAFWVLLAALAVSAESWVWWVGVVLAAWVLVAAVRVVVAHRRAWPPRP